MNVLIVDDLEESRYLLESILSGNGYEVETASNGSEALEMLKSGTFELIISDILMPVMDGFQLCQIVKSDKEFQNIPFIFYTATYTGPKDEEFAIKIGADLFIIKPCEPDVLIAAVRDVITATKNRDNRSNRASLRNEDMLKLYNERLVRKLEQKMLQLEEEVRVRKKTEAELRKSNIFLDTIFENIPDVICLKDVSEFRYVRCNRAAEELLGYTREELIGRRVYDIFPKELADVLTAQDREALEKKEVLNISEEKTHTRNNEIRILHTKKVPVMGPDGEPLYILGISSDITELKKAEDERNRLSSQLLQSQKLESLGTLAGGIAHDFNNILAAIIGFSEIALFDVEKGSQVERSLQEVYRAGMRAKDLVKQILTFARQSDEEIRPIKPEAVVQESLMFLRSSIPATIRIDSKIVSDSLIMGNPTQFHQVIMNLFTNAAQAMEQGGLLGVRLEDVTFKTVTKIQDQEIRPGDYIKLSVSDTGAGIHPDIIGAIFEPYYTTKTPGKGTGLGLALVHSIVESYGGRVGVESEPGNGTVFSVYIPVTRKLIASSAYEQKELPRGVERILFVDDEESIVNAGSMLIQQLGYVVTACKSSRKALELFRQNPDSFDLVITDMTMPELTGDRLAVEIMKIRPGTPVILCTGYSKNISQNIKNTGIKELAYKPFIKAELAKTIRKVLDEEKV